jgi:putative spermidine/putrescine transport system substrate-binding protein
MRAGQHYAVPFTYSEMGLIYDLKQFSKPPTSMSEMWNPKYQGKILLYDGTNHNYSFTALTLGFKQPHSLNDKQFFEVVKKLYALMTNQPKFYLSPEDGTQSFISNKMALMFGNYGYQQVNSLVKAGAKVGYIIPKEGALAWLDCWSILRGAKNISLAEKWINFVLSKKISDLLTIRQNLPNTLSPPRFKKSDKIYWLLPVEDPEHRQFYWNRVRQGKERK